MSVVIAIIGWQLSLTPDFSVSVNPMDGSVQQGGTASTTVTVKGIDGYDHSVSLTASGQPSDMIPSFTPNAGGPKPAYASNLLLTVNSNVPPDDYHIVIKGTGADGKEHTCTYTLTVKPSITVKSTYVLSVASSPSGVSFTLDGVDHKTPFSTTLDEGNYGVAMPSTVNVAGTTYVFANWSDGSTDSTKTVNLLSDVSLTANFEEEILPSPTYVLSVSSSPISVVSFTLDNVSHTTPFSVTLDEGNYVVAVPLTVDVGGTTYIFANWSDGSTAFTRTVNLSNDMSLLAYFEEELPPLELTITYPPSDALVSQTITLEGYANTELGEDQHMYIVVEYEGSWWPQDDEVTFVYSPSTDRYNFNVLVGVGNEADVGETFIIRAILVDSVVHQHFQSWLQQSEITGEWLGISVYEVNEMGDAQTFYSVSVTRQ